jgi:hypothetical protein
MARVQVSDEIWSAYRAGLRTTPVSIALGELVRREVGRMTRRSANDAEGVRQALDDARELADELASLIARLEQVSSANHVSDPESETAGGDDASPWSDDLLTRASPRALVSHGNGFSRS